MCVLACNRVQQSPPTSIPVGRNGQIKKEILSVPARNLNVQFVAR